MKRPMVQLEGFSNQYMQVLRGNCQSPNKDEVSQIKSLPNSYIGDSNKYDKNHKKAGDYFS